MISLCIIQHGNGRLTSRKGIKQLQKSENLILSAETAQNRRPIDKNRRTVYNQKTKAGGFVYSLR